MPIRRHSKGETISETLVALSILALGIAITGLVVTNAMRNLRVSKDRVVATNIARGGIEGMRSIRDSNWLKFSGNRRACWNHFPGQTLASDSCDGSTPILPGQYILYKNNEFRWKLAEATQSPEDSSWMHQVDIDAERDSDGDGNPTNDLDLFSHLTVGDDDALSFGSRQTVFRRVIGVEYLKNEPADEAPSNETPPEDSISTESEWNLVPDPGVLNRMRVTATVSWEDNNPGSDTHTVEMKTILTDYLGRSSLSN